jgi:hypothetical protein
MDLTGYPRLDIFKTRQAVCRRAKKPEWEMRGVFIGKKCPKWEKECKKRDKKAKMGGGEGVFRPHIE